MHPAMKSLKNAMAYAKFTDPDIRDAALEVIEQVGVELQEEDYELGTISGQSVEELEEILNNVDSAGEDTDAAINNAISAEGEEEDEPRVDESPFNGQTR